MRVLLAGGGTAGHTNPLIATAKRLLVADPGTEILCVGTPKGLEQDVIPAAGLELALIDPVPMPRKMSPSVVLFPARLLRATLQARSLLKRGRFDVAVGFGGYASIPVYLAARMLRIPIVVHEQNVLPGLANKVGARFTKDVAVTFPDTPLPNAHFIGLPMREGIASLDRAARREEACRQFDLNPDRPVLLVSGGSQGAMSLNRAIRGAIADVLASGMDVLHILGPKNMTDEIVPVEVAGGRYRPVQYVSAMEDAYAASSLMIGRCGAGTVVETSVVGLPAVYVPWPHGNGEQERNAAPVVAAGAAVVVHDSELTSEWINKVAVPLGLDSERLQTMSDNARALMPADADAALVAMIRKAVAHATR